MLYVKIPKEIRDYEEKMFLGLSLRQMFWGGLSLTLGVATYLLSSKVFGIGTQICSYIVMVIVFPTFACGYIKINDMYCDKYVKIYIKYRFGQQQFLYKNYQTERRSKNASKGIKKIKEYEE